MRLRTGLAFVLACSGLAGSAHAIELAPPCTPVTPVEGVQRQSPELRAAIERLVAETAQGGRPWSCRGGTVDVRAQDDGSLAVTVRRTDASPAVTRVVASVDDVVPLARALLAMPEPEPEPPPERPAPRAPEAATERRASALPEPTSPLEERAPATPAWLLLSAGADVRYAIPSEVLLVGPRLAATLPFGPAERWTAGLWARGGAPAASLREGPGLGEVVWGAALGVRAELEPVELRGAVTGGAAVVVRDRPRPASSEAIVTPRAGFQGEIAAPASGPVRIVASLGVEVDPAHLAEGDARAGRAPYPAVSVGGAIGVEIALR